MENFTTSNESSTYNILLIGKNDYLKSLALNALTNYLKHRWYENYIKLMEVVPMNVNFFDKKTYKSKSITFGKNAEAPSTATLSCHLLLSIRYPTKVVRIIECLENETTLSQFTEIHKLYGTLNGIIYLITSGDTTFFTNQLKQILSILSKSAIGNVVFCFTFNGQSDYNIDEVKKLLEHELLPFNLDKSTTCLKNGFNCFYIDCEPFQQVLAYKRGEYKILERDKKVWEKSSENAYKILQRISDMEPYTMYNFEEYTISEDSKYFFTVMEKSIKNLEELINSTQNEISTETDRLKSFEYKYQNNGCHMNTLDEIKSKSNQVKVYLEEQNSLKKCTQEFVNFIFSKSKQDIKKFITPFILEFLSLEKTENKKIKIESNLAEDSPDAKLQNFINSIKINTSIEPKEIINSIAKLSTLKTSGKYFNKNFAYFQTKHEITDPSLNKILVLVERVVVLIEHFEKYFYVYRKSIREMENADQSKIRIVCFKNSPKQICHQECECKEKDIVLNVKGHPSAQKCKTIDTGSEQCIKCTCSWKEHFHKTTKDLINFMKSWISLRQNELNIIYDVAAKFDYLLMKHSQTCLNNYVNQCLNIGSNEILDKFKDEHWKNVLKLIKSNEKVELTNIIELCEELYKLKISGNYLKGVKQDVNMANATPLPDIDQQKPTCSTSSNSGSNSNIKLIQHVKK